MFYASHQLLHKELESHYFIYIAPPLFFLCYVVYYVQQSTFLCVCEIVLVYVGSHCIQLPIIRNDLVSNLYTIIFVRDSMFW